ncbi:ribosomal lysine N-methyltransferase 4 [Trichomonascus vanleenenianus]|uniref:ribosomal lysine N-methyltransferase n=1 Tax=Trichomonascus vanleenenianus TaxID=2268995 RepID=UPI003ECA09EA
MVELSFEEQSQAFMDWLKARGYTISPKIALHDYRNEGQGRGVIATEDIPKDEVLFTIPRDKVLSIDNDNAFAEFVAGENDNGPWLNLIAYMMALQNSPEWKPYFDVLPRTFNTPMFWPEQDVTLLKGSTVVDKIAREEAEEQFQETIQPLFSKSSAFNGVDQSVDAFHRMGSLIMSYSFDIRAKEPHQEEEEEEEDEEEEEMGVKAMVPMADMLNAHTRLCNAHLCHTDNNSVLEMRATKPIKKGEQVYNTYGDVPNIDLLRRYGYVEAGGTEFDVVEVETKRFAQAIAHLNIAPEDRVLKELNELAEDEENPFYDESYDIPLNGEAEDPLLVTVMYLNAVSSSDEINTDKDRQRLLKYLIKLCEDEKVTEGLPQIWESALQMRLSDYPQSLIDEARANLGAGVSDKVVVEHEEMAHELLLGEIRILLRSLDWVKELDTVPLSVVLSKVQKRAAQPNSTNPSKKHKR